MSCVPFLNVVWNSKPLTDRLQQRCEIVFSVASRHGPESPWKLGAYYVRILRLQSRPAIIRRLSHRKEMASRMTSGFQFLTTTLFRTTMGPCQQQAVDPSILLLLRRN